MTVEQIQRHKATCDIQGCERWAESIDPIPMGWALFGGEMIACPYCRECLDSRRLSVALASLETEGWRHY